MREVFPRGKKGILWTRFTGPDGREVYVSTRTTNEALAREWVAKTKAELFRVHRLGERPRIGWQKAAVRWLDEKAGKDSIEKDRANLLWLDPHFGKLYLDQIDEDRLAEVARARLAEPANKRRNDASKAPRYKRRQDTQPPRETSPATVNRMLALIRSILRRAHQKWKWLDTLPHIEMLPEPKQDLPEIPLALAERVMAELPEHLQGPCIVALSTGLRDQNVLRLRWSQIDMAGRVAYVKGSQAKGDKPIGVPLNSRVLRVLRARKGLHDEWVFHNPKTGQPYVRSNNTAFRAARIRAGAPTLTWHSWRHAWASWHAQSGTPMLALKELGGWRSLSMVDRYSHFAVQHLKPHADRQAAVQKRGKSKTRRQAAARKGRKSR